MQLQVIGRLNAQEKTALLSAGLVEKTAYCLRYASEHDSVEGVGVTVVGFEAAHAEYKKKCSELDIEEINVSEDTLPEDWYTVSGPGRDWIMCEKVAQVWVTED